MTPAEEKRDALARANELLAREDDASLRYAALELRRCIEAVVYEKLWAYRDRLPTEAATRWQPPQAFRALLLVEPNADSTRIIRYRKESASEEPPEPMRTLGVDERPNASWLTKTYNKLGSTLHAAWPFARKPTTSNQTLDRKFLQETAASLDRFVRTSFTSTFANIVEFECVVCKSVVKINEAALNDLTEIACLNPDCGCRYAVSKEGEQYAFKLDALYPPCPQCSNEIRVPSHLLSVGYKFSCANCGCKCQILSQTWDYDREQSPDDIGQGSG